jgi:tetratricopeptide (TPR) repeat protein
MRGKWLAAVCALAMVPLLGSVPAWAAPLDEAVTALQHEWEVIRYQTPAPARERRFEELATRAHQVTLSFPGRSEPLVWEGIIVSSWAGEKGGLGALSLVKRARALYEDAIRIDGAALDGSAFGSLGVLYYKVPSWPIGFGDKDKARELLRKALQVSPQGMDANFFYAEFLVEVGQPEAAVGHLEKVLAAEARPGRTIADTGRKQEARELLARLRGR